MSGIVQYDRKINTTDSLKHMSHFECDTCRKPVKVVYPRSNGRETCADCTPVEDQIVEVIEE